MSLRFAEHLLMIEVVIPCIRGDFSLKDLKMFFENQIQSPTLL